MRLYHYRPVKNGLIEIEKGTFHFSDREELNDPIEGYIQIFWQGDKPAWEGLFRNYIASFFYSIFNYLVEAPYNIICDTAVIPSIKRFCDIPLGELLEDLGNTFIADDCIKEIIDLLGQNKTQYSAKQLKILLRLIHETAYSVCVEKIKKNKLCSGLIPEPDTSMLLKNIKKEIPVDMWSKIGAKDQTVLTKVVEATLDSLEDQIELQMAFCEDAGDLTFSQRQIWFKLHVDFPDLYIRQMQEMIYPKGYVVCFSGNGTNSVMWGNYADNHRGICLIYQTEAKSGKETIPVKTGFVTGTTGSSFYFVQNEVMRIEYSGAQIKRNFFESLGRLNYNELTSWLMPDGCNSSLYLSNSYDEKWREQYWKDYNRKYCSKMPVWAYEEEYRILTSDSSIHSYSSSERNIEYKTDILIGVIFGMKTSIQDKKDILKSLEKSGKDLNKVEFYQAEYDDDTCSILLRKKYRLSKFKSQRASNNIKLSKENI